MKGLKLWIGHSFNLLSDWFTWLPLIANACLMMLWEHNFLRLTILATLLGCQGIDEFKVMLNASYNFGVTPVEMKEIVYLQRYLLELEFLFLIYFQDLLLIDLLMVIEFRYLYKNHWQVNQSDNKLKEWIEEE